MITRMSRINYCKINSNIGKKEDIFMSFSRFCDLDLDFQKVTADSLPYFFICVFIYNISYASTTNIKGILHKTLGKLTKKLIRKCQFKPFSCIFDLGLYPLKVIQGQQVDCLNDIGLCNTYIN